MIPHTPGPWRQHSEHPERIILNGSAGYEVRHAWDEDCRPNPADVRLMAAAPEFLRLCEKLCSLNDSRPYFDSVSWRQACDECQQTLDELRKLMAEVEGRADANS